MGAGASIVQYRKILSNISVAFVAQGISLLLSVILSLFVPKFLGVEEFGYWQLFLFYASLCGVFHFGLNDGIYLIYGGVPFSRMNYESMGGQFRFGLGVEFILSAAFAFSVWFFVPDGERQVTLFFVAAYMPINNAAYFLGFVFQAADETKWFSFSIVADKLTLFVAVIALILLQVNSSTAYIVSYLIARCAALLYCAIRGRVILLARSLPLRDTARETFRSVQTGISLTLANVSGLLILGGMRFVVDARWGIESFGQLSLAISLDNFILVFMQQVSMVLFPALRQGGGSERRSLFVFMSNALSCAMPFVYVCALPLKALLDMWLPAYAEASSFFLMLLPLCVFEARMSMVGTTFFKVYREERKLLLVNGCSAIAALILSIIGSYILESINFVIIFVVCVFVARSLFSELYLSRIMCLTMPAGQLAGLLALSCVYYVAIAAFDPLVAFFSNLLCYVLYVAANRRFVREILVKIAKLYRS